MQHLVKTPDNIQPNIMSTPNPTHLLDKPLKPIPFGHLSTITESPLHDSVTPTQPQPHFSQTITPVTNTPHITTTTVPLLNLSTNPQQDTHTSHVNAVSHQQSNDAGQNNTLPGSFFNYPSVNNNNPFFCSLNNPDDKPVLRPKDVALLKLSELRGIVADNTLTHSFDK